MKSKFLCLHTFVCLSVGLLVLAWPMPAPRVCAQTPWPFVPPPEIPPTTTPDAQRAAVSQVRTQAGWVQNATRTASSYGAGGADVVGQQFQTLHNTYAAFTRTLNANQAARGANEWAELAAGLGIIAEAFANYQDDVARGRSAQAALRDLCQVLRDATQVWLQQFNRHCSTHRVGW